MSKYPRRPEPAQTRLVQLTPPPRLWERPRDARTGFGTGMGSPGVNMASDIDGVVTSLRDQICPVLALPKPHSPVLGCLRAAPGHRAQN